MDIMIFFAFITYDYIEIGEFKSVMEIDGHLHFTPFFADSCIYINYYNAIIRNIAL